MLFSMFHKSKAVKSKAVEFPILTNALILCLVGREAIAQEAPPQPQNPPSAAISMYNLGLKAYKEASPESAIIFFTRACNINPDLADAQYNLGVLYQTQKRYREAIPRYQEVLRVKPQDPDAHYQLGLCYIDMGQYAEARQHLSTIAPNNPHFADSQRRLSTLDSQPQQGAAPSPAPTVAAPASDQYQQPTNYTAAPTQPAANTSAYSALNQPQALNSSALAYTPPVAVQPLGVGSPPTSAAMPPSATTPPPMPPSHFTQQAGGPVAVMANTSVRVIATGFSAPAGLAFDKQGNLYVANFQSNTVDRINADGSRNQFSSGANLKGPIGLVIDASNNVYVANYYSGTVARISPSGVSTIIATGFKKPYYLTLDREGSLFVSQQEDNSVVRITLPKSPARPI